MNLYTLPKIDVSKLDARHIPLLQKAAELLIRYNPDGTVITESGNEKYACFAIDRAFFMLNPNLTLDMVNECYCVAATTAIVDSLGIYFAYDPFVIRKGEATEETISMYILQESRVAFLNQMVKDLTEQLKVQP